MGIPNESREAAVGMTRGFKVSNDPMFEGQVTEIVGLYLDPPDRAVVLCVDEKSQIQALDRTQPGLPLKKGRAQTSCWKHAFGMMTHDDKRHGTTTLFAALDVKSGMVIGDCMQHLRAKEFLKFLRTIDKAVPARRDVHPILDSEADQKTVRGTVFPLNATHKTAEVRAWLEKHPRFKLHFTPARASLAESGRTVPCRDHIEAHPTGVVA